MFRPQTLGHLQVVHELTEWLYGMCGVFLGRGEGVILYGIEISFVSVVGAWSGTVSLVTHALILVISRISSCTT